VVTGCFGDLFNPSLTSNYQVLSAQINHMNPLDSGGTNEIDNLTLTCSAINSVLSTNDPYFINPRKLRCGLMKQDLLRMIDQLFIYTKNEKLTVGTFKEITINIYNGLTKSGYTKTEVQSLRRNVEHFKRPSTIFGNWRESKPEGIDGLAIISKLCEIAKMLAGLN
jgi:hypothetical protein